MGYDMTIRGKVPAASQHDIEQAQEAYDAAHAVFKKRVDAGEFEDDFTAQMNAAPNREWERLYRLKDPEYFRLNIGGMDLYRTAMLELGMMHISNGPTDFSEYPEWPERDNDPAEMKAYYKAADEFTGRHGDSSNPNLPLHKFGSNDGWYVTPEEINAALEAWERRNLEDLGPEIREVIETDYWQEWIAWLKLAAEHDGFRVN